MRAERGCLEEPLSGNAALEVPVAVSVSTIEKGE
jgi:hypothetical protein